MNIRVAVKIITHTIYKKKVDFMSYTTIAKKCNDITVENIKKKLCNSFFSCYVAFFDTVLNII